jgi:hypothetical protein
MLRVPALVMEGIVDEGESIAEYSLELVEAFVAGKLLGEKSGMFREDKVHYHN